MKESNIEKRFKICESCPIYNPLREQCNPNLYINPDTDDVSTIRKPGYIRGCGCMVKIKARNLGNHCIAGKW